MRLTVLDTEEVSGGIQVRMRQTFELADGDKPVAVADALARLVERQ